MDKAQQATKSGAAFWRTGASLAALRLRRLHLQTLGAQPWLGVAAGLRLALEHQFGGGLVGHVLAGDAQRGAVGIAQYLAANLDDEISV